MRVPRVLKHAWNADGGGLFLPTPPFSAETTASENRPELGGGRWETLDSRGLLPPKEETLGTQRGDSWHGGQNTVTLRLASTPS